MDFSADVRGCSVKTGGENPEATETKVKTKMIYVIQSGDYVKIGFCERDPIRRLEKLQVGNPITMKLIALIDGSRIDESNWHARYDKLRVRGEWFRLNSTLRGALKPHRVDHDEVSRRRPARVIEGHPAHIVKAGFAAMGLEGWAGV